MAGSVRISRSLSLLVSVAGNSISKECVRVIDPVSFWKGNCRGLAGMSKTFREWNVEQHWLLPPSVMDFVPADHIAHFIRDTVREQLDLSEVLASYKKEERG